MRVRERGPNEGLARSERERTIWRVRITETWARGGGREGKEEGGDGESERTLLATVSGRRSARLTDFHLPLAVAREDVRQSQLTVRGARKGKLDQLRRSSKEGGRLTVEGRNGGSPHRLR